MRRRTFLAGLVAAPAVAVAGLGTKSLLIHKGNMPGRAGCYGAKLREYPYQAHARNIMLSHDGTDFCVAHTNSTEWKL